MRVFRWLGRFTLIAGPLAVLIVFVLTAFLMWVLLTAPGTRWALHTAGDALDGEVTGVEGSGWNGLRIGDLSLSFPGVDLRLGKAELASDWRRLLDRQLHAHTLRRGTAWVDLHSGPADSAPAEAAEEPCALPELPVWIRI